MDVDPAHRAERYLTYEETDAGSLDEKCTQARMLHDRRLPGSSATIDHIAVAASGVYVIATRRYRGPARVHRRLFRPAKLTIDGSANGLLDFPGGDQSELVEALAKQADTVRAAVQGSGYEVPVHGAFWFLETEFPLFEKSSVDGVLVCGQRGLIRRINRRGPMSEELANEIARCLNKTFPNA